LLNAFLSDSSKAINLVVVKLCPEDMVPSSEARSDHRKKKKRREEVEREEKQVEEESSW